MRGDKAGTQSVKVTSSDAGITKEAAIGSLGSKAKSYVVHTWDILAE